jgi:pyruvate dehydrogenase E2 component (dihydrolipoamide acetyltransferase)
VLTEIKVKEGETVAVNTVVGTIGQPGEEAEAPADVASVRAATTMAAVSTQPQADGQPQAAPPPSAPETPARPAGATAGSGRPSPKPSDPSDLHRQRSSPLVRRIARDNNVDISEIQGSGIGGRVTKHDILAYLEGGQASAARPASVSEPRRSVTATDRVEIQPLSPMRKIIAERMVLSRRTSAHVHSVFHVDFSHIERIRRENKAEYERLGTRLTYMAFIASTVIDAIRRHPLLNASLDGDNVVYHKDVNLGIAVALEAGLIVPVVNHADEKNLLGLSRAIADVADRARSKQLKPEEVQGGTFTITNPGQFGAQFGMPIINQPQVAILGVGTIEKRPVVVDDAIAIRTMAYLTLGYDHRLVDGAVADQFMADVKKQLENFDADKI